MNKYQKILNAVTKEAEAYYKMSVKLKYRDKWLEGGTPMNHPIYISYDKEFHKFSYSNIRTYLKLYYKNITELRNIRDKVNLINKDLYLTLFNEDIKYNYR